MNRNPLKPIPLIFILFIFVKFGVQQHIFEETCEYQVQLPEKVEILKFASQVIHISNDYTSVFINFCKSLQNFVNPTTPASKNCDPGSLVCILSKTGKKKLKTPVTSFHLSAKVNNVTKKVEKLYFQTNSGLKTVDNNDYTLVINVDKTVTEYKLAQPDVNILEINIPHPDVQNRDCAYSYQGLIIDLKPLQSFAEQVLVKNSTKVAIAACRSAESCRDGSSICELSGKNKLFSISNSQYVNYDENKNSLSLRGKKGKLKSELFIKCNWTANFENPTILQKNYQYSIESKLGCIKTPLNCFFRDLFHYEYNLTSLNNPSGWLVTNSSNEIIKINVCGTLGTPNNTECSKTYSQICATQYITTGSHFVSYGSLQNGGLSINGDDIILTYTHGSKCVENPKEFYSTQITFKCFANESGPVLKSIKNCVVSIEWKTTAACTTGLGNDASFSYTNTMKAIRSAKDIDCMVYRNGQMYRFGSLRRDLRDGMSFDSRVMQNFRYHINICAPIVVNRENYYCGVTGACLEDVGEVDLKKRFTSFGGVSQKINPKFEGDELIIRYDGGFCLNSTRREIVITFNCSQTQELLKLTSETQCKADFTWNTPLACKRKTQRALPNCTAIASNKLDKSNTTLKLDEIIVQPFTIKDKNIIYHIDLCSESIVIENNSTSKVINEDYNATTQLLQEKCKFSLIYTILNENNTSGKSCDVLKSIQIDLLCNEIANNPDHVVYPPIYNDCEAVITLKSSYICNYSKCSTVLDGNRSKVDKTIEKQKENEITEIRNEDKHVYDLLADKTKVVTMKSMNKLCKIQNVGNGRHFDIFELKSLNATQKDAKIHKLSDVYVINGDGKACDGFICKNNTILGSLKDCPSVTLIEGEKLVELLFVGPKECNNVWYNVKLTLKCTNANSNRNGKIIKEEECLSEILIATNEICYLFDDKQEDGGLHGAQGNVIGYLIGIIVCLVILLISIGVIWKYKLFRGMSCVCFKKSRLNNEESPVRTSLLYLKNGSD